MAGVTPALGHQPVRGPRAWVGAFTGFYPPDSEAISDLDPITRFLYSARSVILVISAQAALIAGLLAATARHFAAVPFLLTLVGFVVLHAISNLSNDYFGYRRGHDTADSPRRRYTLHPIESGAVSTRLLGTGLALLGTLALAIAVYFVALRGVGALVLAVVGALCLWAYDAAPKALKELGLGEVAAFVVWGPLMVGGGYYVITGQVSAAAVLASVPYGLGVASILTGKHIDQRSFDSAHGQRTLAVLFGERATRTADIGAVVGMYGVIALAVGLGRLTPFALLVALALPRAVRAVRVLAHPAPASPPAGYLGWPLWYHRVCLVHNRMFGWVYLLGLGIGAFLPHWRA
jgi:1,4-dihydroxy-2-naphthoate octaprenyltransferase